MGNETVQPQKRRGPKPTGKGTPVHVRLQPPELERLDNWTAAQPEPQPSRPEAIRYMLEMLTGQEIGRQVNKYAAEHGIGAKEAHQEILSQGLKFPVTKRFNDLLIARLKELDPEIDVDPERLFAQLEQG